MLLSSGNDSLVSITRQLLDQRRLFSADTRTGGGSQSIGYLAKALCSTMVSICHICDAVNVTLFLVSVA